MTEKELDSYMFLTKELKALEEQINNISLITSIPFERIGSNPNYSTRSPQEKNFLKYSELEEKTEERKKDILARLFTMEKFISEVKSDKIRLVINMRYVHRFSWNYIINELHMGKGTLKNMMNEFWENEEKLDANKQKEKVSI